MWTYLCQIHNELSFLVQYTAKLKSIPELGILYKYKSAQFHEPVGMF